MILGDHFCERELGTKAIHYLLKENLRYGRTLSQFLLNRLSSYRLGRITTYLPEHVSLTKLSNFKSGGVILPSPGDKKPTPYEHNPIISSWLLPVIQTFLTSGNNHCFFIEDNEASLGDDWLQQCPTKILYHRNEVYHLLKGPSVEKREIIDMFSWNGSWIFVGILSKLQLPFPTAPNQDNLTSRDLACLAKEAAKIIVAAYDREGFLIWHL